MRILHLCLANFYIDNYRYQENMLPQKNFEQGHDVKIIASTETFIDNTGLGYIKPSEYVTEFGVPIKRIPYSKWLPHFIMKKLRYYRQLYREIESFQPDIIMMHDMSFGSIKDVIRYTKDHAQVVLYADTHTAANNSGRNWISLNILHGLINRHRIQRALPYIKKYFYISEECKKFSKKIYKAPESIMEFFPLGGEIISKEQRETNNIEVRKYYQLTEEHIVFVHSGKMDALKRTSELLQAFSAIPDERFRLFLIGSIPQDVHSLLDKLIEADKRISFLGWKNGEELQKYLCACDLYLQPGSQSATMQIATCCGTPVMLYPHESHYVYDEGNIFFIKTVKDMQQVFLSVSSNPQQLDTMKESAMQLARRMLDYEKLANRICI